MTISPKTNWSFGLNVWMDRYANNMRRKITYKLKRLPDVNGEMNWLLQRITPQELIMHISWDRDYIKNEVAQLKVGETKIIEI